MPKQHKYDAPDITMIELLREIARDTSLPMLTRIDAAAKALPYEFPIREREPWPGEPRITIIIGGMPADFDPASVRVEAKGHEPPPPVIGHA